MRIQHIENLYRHHAMRFEYAATAAAIGTTATVALYSSLAASVAATAAGAGLSMYSQQQQAKTASAIADYNYDIERQNAEVQSRMAQQQALWRQQAAQVQYQQQQNNAIAYDQQAQAVEQQAQEKIRRMREEADRTMATKRAAYAKSGITTEGSPIVVLAEAGGLLELGQQDALYDANLEASAWRRKATDERYQSKFSLFNQAVAKYEGDAAKVGKILDLQRADINLASGRAEAEGHRIASYGSLIQGASDIASTSFSATSTISQLQTRKPTQG